MRFEQLFLFKKNIQFIPTIPTKEIKMNKPQIDFDAISFDCFRTKIKFEIQKGGNKKRKKKKTQTK